VIIGNSVANTPPADSAFSDRWPSSFPLNLFEGSSAAVVPTIRPTENRGSALIFKLSA
ncbi:hypothetical protein CEXT_600361, partial [Caerostris extrusa]